MIKSAGSATLLTALFILSAAHAADQDYCKAAFAIGNMPGMTECSSMELEAQDKRLNAEYKAVMAKLDAKQKKELRSRL